MFYLVRPFFFTLSSILNLRSSTFAHRSGPSYHFSLLPCHPCNFSPFFIPSSFLFSTINNSHKAEIDQQLIVAVLVLFGFLPLHSHTIAQKKLTLTHLFQYRFKKFSFIPFPRSYALFTPQPPLGVTVMNGFVRSDYSDGF